MRDTRARIYDRGDRCAQVFGRGLGGASTLPLRQQGRVELALIFGPASLVGLGVLERALNR